MIENKKKKYIEKKIKYVEKVEEKITIVEKKEQKEKEQPKKQSKTTVINVKVKFLRQKGYQSLLDWLQNDNHVYVGRNMTHYVPGAVGSKWANPFKVDKYGREACIQKYKEYILSNKQLLSDVKNLKGKVLGCWCAPEGCHGDVLAELAENY